jgi:hypothetical protein
MIIYDSFSKQFMLHDYIFNLNSNLAQYIENSNININYYCFHAKVNNSTHYIITSCTTKKKDNGNKIITIKICTDFFEENSIIALGESLTIKFENICVQVDKYTNILKVEIHTCKSILSHKMINCVQKYNSNIPENNVTEVINAYNPNMLSNLENLLTVVFHDNFNKIIYNNTLSKSVINLTFGSRYNQIINSGILPESLHTLTFGYDYNQIININVLPKLLHILTFGSIYNQILIAGVLPELLHTLTFGYQYNRTINVGVLPKMLQILTFGHMFSKNIKLEVLPTSLHTLALGRWWNNILPENVLPNSLETLTLSKYYNQVIGINVLPRSIKEIRLNCHKESRPYTTDSIIPEEFKSKLVCWNVAIASFNKNIYSQK